MSMMEVTRNTPGQVPPTEHHEPTYRVRTFKPMSLHVDLTDMELDSSLYLQEMRETMLTRHAMRRARMLHQDDLWSDVTRALTHALMVVTETQEKKNRRQP